MPMAERTARVEWLGDLAHGSGRVSAASGAFAELPVTWASRTVRSDGMTSPEELIAAAHASCYSMGLSLALAQAGNPPERLLVTAVCTLDLVHDVPTITRVDLDVVGRVPGVDAQAFAAAAEGARDGCPVSRALKGNLIVTVKSRLE
jgi:lipoyl-dependent peroxiredoxin